MFVSLFLREVCEIILVRDHLISIKPCESKVFEEYKSIAICLINKRCFFDEMKQVIDMKLKRIGPKTDPWGTADETD